MVPGFAPSLAAIFHRRRLDALMAAIDDHALPQVWVLELSSFQLETTQTLNAEAATVLNVSEDHLDRYTGMDDYAATKARVFQGSGAMVVNRDDPRCLPVGSDGRRPVSFGLNAAPGTADYGLADGWLMRGSEKVIALSALQLPGLHNAANAMAALALCAAVGVAPRAVLEALAAFKGLPHRVERVASVGGVSYYDDSKGTNVGATLAAVEGMGCKVAIILGGEGKEQDFSPLKAALAEHGRAIALIGRDAMLIGAAIDGCNVPVKHCADLAEAVRWCAVQALPETPCCSRRRARVSICSAVTCIVPKCSSSRCARCKARRHDDSRHRRAAPDAGRSRSHLAVERPGAAAGRHGDGLFGVDRDRRSRALYGKSSDLFSGSPRRLSGHRSGRRRLRFPGLRWRPGRNFSPWLFVAGVVLLALVLIPGIGRDVNGARRWIALGFVNPQPSEFMKLFAVL